MRIENLPDKRILEQRARLEFHYRKQPVYNINRRGTYSAKNT